MNKRLGLQQVDELYESSAEQSGIFTLTFTGARLEYATGAAALEAFAAPCEFHLGVRDADITPASTPASSPATTSHSTQSSL